MTRTNQRKKLVFLTEEQKMALMKEYDTSGLSAAVVCKQYGISMSNLYKIKEVYWPIYQATKDTGNKMDQIATINTIKVHNTRKAVLVETQASEVIGKALNLMLHKLDMEEDRLRGVQRFNEDGTPFRYHDKDIVTVADLTKFFQAAAPYFMKSVDPNATDTRGMKGTHSFIQNIMNNLTVTNNNNNTQDGTVKDSE